MSLINQMLKDLETRRADGAERASLPNEVRSLPPERESLWPRLAVGAVAVAFLAGGAALWMRMEAPESTTPAMPKPIAQSAPVRPAAATAVPADPAAQSAVQAAPSALPPVAETQKAAPPAESEQPKAPEPLKEPEPPRKASSPPEPRPAALARVEPVKPGKETARREQETALKFAASLAAGREAREQTVTPKPAAPALRTTDGQQSIEKQVRISTPHDRAENEYRKAISLLNQGRINDAIAGFRTALQEEPSHANARLTLLGILVEQRRLDDAQSLLKEGLALNPAQPQLAMRLARIQLERGDLRGADETLQEAAAEAIGNAEYRGFHAAVLQRLNRHKDAVGEYKAALRLAPQAGVWWMGLGISLDADGRASEAREAFQRARATGALSAELDRFVEQKLRAGAAQ